MAQRTETQTLGVAQQRPFALIVSLVTPVMLAITCPTLTRPHP